MRSFTALKPKLFIKKSLNSYVEKFGNLSRRSNLILASFLIISSTLLPLFPTPKASAASGTYVAMGDSYSAGYGEANLILRGWIEASNFLNNANMTLECERTLEAYPLKLKDRLGYSKENFYFLPCAGATSRGNAFRDFANQLYQLSKIPNNQNIRLITLTLGGNDIKFADWIVKCSRHNSCDGQPLDDYISKPNTDPVRRQLLTTVFRDLSQNFLAVRNSATNASVWVGGYPRLFTGSSTDACTSRLLSIAHSPGRFDSLERQWIRRLSDDLNNVISAAASYAGVHFADPRNSFEGHNICDTDDFYNETVHPNNSGNNAYANTFMGQAGFQALLSNKSLQVGTRCDPDKTSFPCTINGSTTPIGSISTGNPSSGSTLPTPPPAQNGGPCAESADRLLLYEHIGFGGRCASVGVGEYASLRNINFAWQLSSLKMGSQLRAVFCEGENFTGRCEGFDRTDDDIYPDSWNDKVGSLKVQYKPAPPPGGLGDPTCTEGPKKVVLFEIQGYRGRCTAMEIGDYPAQWMFQPLPSDLLSALKVGDDVSVEICAQENFVDCTTWGTDADLSNDGWNDRMKSLRVYLTPPQPVCAYSADQIAIHDWPNWRGSCATLDIGTYPGPREIPENLNDQIESLRIGANVKVWLCADPNFENTCSLVTGDIGNLSGTRVGGQTVSSLRIMPKDEPGPCEGTFEEIVLFEFPNFEGSCHVFKLGFIGVMYAESDYHIRYLNDRAQSVKVNPGARVMLCRDPFLTGPCSTFTESANLEGTTVDRGSVSSLNVERAHAFVCDPNSTQFAIYDQVNYQGECTIFAMNEEEPDLSAAAKLGNLRAESVRVGANARAILCRGIGLSDVCDQFNDDDPDLNNNAIGNNTVQSARNRSKDECVALPGTVVFFDLPNYDGLCIRSRAADYPDAINLGWLTDNRVESIRIAEDLQLKICKSNKSVCMTLRGDVSDLTGYPVGPNLTYYAKMKARTFACNTFMYYSEYFDNPTLNGEPVTKRCEHAPDYDWGAGAPAETNLPADNFSARWTSEQPLIGGTYTFTGSIDDGYKYWIDGAIAAQNWKDNNMTLTPNFNKVLKSGDHTFKLEYYEKTGNAVAKFKVKPYIPPSSCRSTQFMAEYYPNRVLSGTPTMIRCEGSVNYAWGTGGPSGALVGNENFSARWTNTKSYTAGTYRFSVTADNGIKVWLDDVLIIDKWLNQTFPATATLDRTLTAGNHTVKIEYFEKNLDATAKFSVTHIP